MGIISTLKSVLGLGDGRADDRGTAVTVEREVDGRLEDAATVAGGEAADAESERAVKGMADDAIEEETAPAADEPAGTDEPVDVIKGIGAAYAERLGEAGVETVADLAGADPDALAERTGLGAGRVEGWVERARTRTE